MIRNEMKLVIVIICLTIFVSCVTAIVISDLLLKEANRQLLEELGIDNWKVPLSVACITFLCLTIGIAIGAAALWCR